MIKNKIPNDEETNIDILNNNEDIIVGNEIDEYNTMMGSYN